MLINSVGFISEYDISDVSVRSGVPFFLFKNLKAINQETFHIHVNAKRSIFQRLKSRAAYIVYEKLLRKGAYNFYFSLRWANELSEALKSAMHSMREADIYIGINILLFYKFRPKKPFVLWIDNTYSSFHQSAYISPSSSVNIKEMRKVERDVFSRAAHIYVCSLWLKEIINKDYEIPPEKISILERGANLEEYPIVNIVTQYIDARIKMLREEKIIRILFQSSHFLRKGGIVVFEVLKLLDKSGINYELHVIGNVPKEYTSRKNVFYHGYINKNAEFDKYEKIMSGCHILLLPSLGDGFGLAFAEAAWYGIPSLAYRIMGVPSSVKEGKNGILVEPQAGPQDFYNVIQDFINAPDELCDLSFSAYRTAVAFFDWKKNVNTILAPKV